MLFPQKINVVANARHANPHNETVVVQNDTAVEFYVAVVGDNGQTELPEGATYTLVCLHLRKQPTEKLGTLQADGNVMFKLTHMELSETGPVQGQVRVYHPVGGRLTSNPFIFHVAPDPTYGAEIKPEDQSIIEQVIGEGPGIIAEAKKETELNITERARLTGAVGGALNSLAQDKAEALLEMSQSKAAADESAQLAQQAAGNADEERERLTQEVGEKLTEVETARSATVEATGEATEAAELARVEAEAARLQKEEVQEVIGAGPVASVNGKTGVVDGLATQESVNQVTAQLAEKVGGQVKLKPEEFSDEAMALVTGNGTVNVLSEPQPGSVTDSKLSPDLLDRIALVRGAIPSETDLNYVLSNGTYIGNPNGSYINAPADLQANRTFHMSVEKISPIWVVQTITSLESSQYRSWRRFASVGNPTGVNNPWNFVGSAILAGSIGRESLKNQYGFNGNISNNTNIFTLAKEGTYLGLSSNQYTNIPIELIGKSFLLRNYAGREDGVFGVQELVEVKADGTSGGVFWRRYRTQATDHTAWHKFTAGEGGAIEPKKPFEGKTIVQFGDSIYGNKRPPKDISTTLAQKTGATVFNAGMGGSRMAQHNQFWDATSMYRLADAIATNDWSMQNELIAEYDAGRLPNLPYYVKAVINDLKAIDFNSVDIVTLAHGTNDFTTENVTGENAIDPLDTSTYGGALRHSIRVISEVFPHIKIVVISPMYRFWTDSASPYNFQYDSDTFEVAGELLTDYVEIAERVSKEEKQLYFDAYYRLGINKHNRHYYFDDLTGAGGTHHSDAGAMFIGERIGAQLMANY